ncbi:MAG: hypothetical protein HY788_03150 [Deltaproteobacteria bacterium]|nr:hypothetical protein [Deltaproteobacteria bacterium]
MKPYIIGVGRRGAEIVQKQLRTGLADTVVLFADTDADDLELRPEESRLRLGASIPPGEVIRNTISFSYDAAMQDRDAIKSRLSGAGIVILVAGLGGGTGPGGSEAIARMCEELGIPVVAFVTKPFRIEGESRLNRGRIGFRKVYNAASLIVSFPQDVIIPYSQRITRVRELIDIVDEFVVAGIQACVETAADESAETALRSLIAASPEGVFGYGLSDNPDGMDEALTFALESPFIKSISLSRAKGLAVTVRGSKSPDGQSLRSDVGRIVDQKCPEAKVIIRQTTDHRIDGLQISLLLTGEFGESIPLPMDSFTPVYEG